jgi:NAD(P)-dependent dehydrogenase (short-subunit alcohol dehydrogenase family)
MTTTPTPVLLDGKVGIVSGVGPGLGRSVAIAFARAGAAVVLGARTESYLAEVQASVEDLGGRALGVVTDITDPDQCDRLARAAVDAFGRLDVVVHNAAAPDVAQPFATVDLDEWRHQMDVNLFGALQLTHSAIPFLGKSGGGSIVFVNSMIVRKILPNQGGYATSKAALLSAAHVLARELGPQHIRVNSVVPGWLWGPSVERVLRRRARDQGSSVEEQAAELTDQIPLGVIPSSDDAANAVVFFASDLSSVITGQSLDVNGGEVFH